MMLPPLMPPVDRRSSSVPACLLATFLVLLGAAPAMAQKPIPIAAVQKENVTFEGDVLPILRAKCLACHSASEEYGGLVLETPATILRGGDSGPAAVAGKGAESLLLRVATHQAEPVMPPPENDVAAKPLTSQELGLLKLWIDQGAKGSGLAGVLSPTRWRPLPPGTHPVYTVATTPDGQFVACGRANQIFIYHLATGQLITRLTDPALQQDSRDDRPGIAHLDVVQSLAFNPTGDRLASGGFRTAKIWRYPRDVQRASLPGGEAAVTAVAVSPDRARIATGGADQRVRVFDAVSGELLLTLEGHADQVTGLRFSHDSRRLFSGSLDKSIRVWDLAAGQLAGRILTPEPVRALTTVREPLPEMAEQTATGDVSADTATDAQAADDARDAEASPSDATVAVPRVKETLVSGGEKTIRRWQAPTRTVSELADAPTSATLLAVNSERTRIALADASGKVQLRDAASGEVLHAWQAHETAIHAVAFAPPQESPALASAANPQAAGAQAANSQQTAADVANGESDAKQVVRRLATAGEDGTVRLWDVASGTPLLVLRGTRGAVRSLAFSPEGTRLTAGMADGQVTTWELEEQPSRWQAQQTSAATVTVTSPDGKLVASSETAQDRAAIVVRQTTTGETVATLLGHQAAVTSLRFNADGTRLVSGSADKSARVWDLRDPKFPQVASFDQHAAPVTAVAFNADASRVLSGSADGGLKFWSVANVEEQVDCTGHTGAIVGVAVTPAGQAVSASADKTIRFWDAAGKTQRSVTVAAPITSFAANGDVSKLAAAASDKNVYLYQAANGTLLATWNGLPAAAQTLRFSGDGTRVLAADSASVSVWRVEDGRLLEIVSGEQPLTSATFGETPGEVLLSAEDGSLRPRALHFHLALAPFGDAVTGMVYRADGQLLFAASTDGTVCGLNTQTGQAAFQANHGAAVHDLALDPSGQRLVSGGEDKQVKVWNAANGAALAPTALTGFTGPVRAVRFAAEGTQVVAGSGGETPETLIFNAATGEVLEELDLAGAAPFSLAVLGDAGRAIYVSSATGRTARYESHALQTVAGHTAPITSLAALDGLQILSGSEDGTLRHWNLEAATPQVRVFNHGAPVTDVAASPDGTRFASASSNHTARLWNAANGQQLAQMTGDLEAQALVAKLTREQQDWTAKVTAAKTTLEAAQKVVPTKQTADTQAATALATAEKDVQAKMAALAKAETAKAQAEQQAIQMAAAAQLAARKMNEAVQQAVTMQARAKRLSDKATQTMQLAQADPDNQQLAEAAQAAQTAAAAAQKEAQAAEAAKAAPTAAAQTAATAAQQAAQQAVAMAKPFEEAATALATSRETLRTATLAHELAARELKQAQDAVPEAQAVLTKAEKTLQTIQTQLETATQAETAARQPIHCVRFSPDGQVVATGGELGVVHTWDGQTGKPISSYSGHEGPVRDVRFLSTGELVSAADDQQSVIWTLNPRWELERVIGDIADPTTLVDRVAAVDFSADGQWLATGGGVPSRSGEVKIWNVSDGTLVRDIPEAHTDAVNDVAFSQDGTQLASAAADKFVRTWDVETGRQTHQFEGHTDHVLSVAWRSNGKMLVSAGADATLRVWNAETGDRIRDINGYNKQVTNVAFVGQSQFFMTTSGDPLVRMHNSDNGGVQRNFAGAEDYMYGVSVTPDGSLVVAGGHDGILRIWNGTNGQVLHTIGPPEPPVSEQAAVEQPAP